VVAKYSRLTTSDEDISPVQHESACSISQTLFPSAPPRRESRPIPAVGLPSVLALPLRITSTPRRPRFWPLTRRRTHSPPAQVYSVSSVRITLRGISCVSDRPPQTRHTSHPTIAPRRPRQDHLDQRPTSLQASKQVSESSASDSPAPIQLKDPQASRTGSYFALPSPKVPKSRRLPGRHESKHPDQLGFSACSLAPNNTLNARAAPAPATLLLTALRDPCPNILTTSPLHKRKQAKGKGLRKANARQGKASKQASTTKLMHTAGRCSSQHLDADRPSQSPIVFASAFICQPT